VQLQPAFLIAGGRRKADLVGPSSLDGAFGKKVWFLHCVIIYDIKQGAHIFQKSRTHLKIQSPPER
jgi:hypothetical protein